ncbi:MAG: lipase family protein [Clostridiales bacterium]|nr:lipase family protein [Clostridiales bacterium]
MHVDLYELFSTTINTSYIELEENSASYMTTVVDDVLYLYFEKSNGATDWKNNLDFPAKPYHEMQDTWYVHRGFLRVFKTIKPFIAPYVADRKINSIVISGYSHGAALALLAHEYCIFNRPDIAPNILGYGFGCPRVLWGKLPEKLQARFTNFTVVRNCRDIVTHLPPVLFGFHHVGNLLHIGKDANYNSIDSHRAENYLTSLRLL